MPRLPRTFDQPTFWIGLPMSVALGRRFGSSMGMSQIAPQDPEPKPGRAEEYKEQPGEEKRPTSEDEALDDTFPASDPVGSSIIDGPND